MSLVDRDDMTKADVVYAVKFKQFNLRLLYFSRSYAFCLVYLPDVDFYVI